MLRSTFNKYFPDGKNPRNQCAGIVKRLDGKDMDKLVFIAYDVFDDDNIVDKNIAVSASAGSGKNSLEPSPQ